MGHKASKWKTQNLKPVLNEYKINYISSMYISIKGLIAIYFPDHFPCLRHGISIFVMMRKTNYD